MASYQPAKGAQYNAKQAVVLGKVLEQLGESVTPQQVVDAARPAKSPIHSLFEWNDTEAAEAYRLWQARSHISHLEIVVRTPEGDIETRAYHSVVIVTEDTKARGYSHMANIQRSPALAQQVIANALRELEGWQKRYGEYDSIFGGVFTAINRAKRRVRKRQKVSAA